MRSEQMWMDDERESATPSLTRRGMLAGSLKLAGAGALALAVAGGPAMGGRLALAQEEDAADDMEAEGEAAGAVEGGIQVGTTDDAAAGAQVEGEAAAGAELPPVEGETEADREARRAARGAEEAAGETAVAAVPNTGVGAVASSSLGGAIGAIGLAAAGVTGAILTRRDAFRRGAASE